MQEAAKFIWHANTALRAFPIEAESEVDIYDFIRETAIDTSKKNYRLILKERETGKDLSNEWITYTGTGGFYLTFELMQDEIDKIEIGVEISIDPAIGMSAKSIFITELIDHTV